MLKTSRISDINLIPRRLINQIDRRPYTIDEFYEYYKEPLTSSTIIFEVIINDENNIIGFVNYSIDRLYKEIYINILSIDKEHQHDKETLPFIINCFKKLGDVTYLNIVWHCYKSAYFIKSGFNKADGDLLQYSCH